MSERGVRAALARTRPYQVLRHWRECLRSPDYRATDRKVRGEFEAFCRQLGGAGLGQDVLPRGGERPRTALLVTIGFLSLARLESFMLKVLQAAGFETVVLGDRSYQFLRYYWLARAKAVVSWPDFGLTRDPEWIDERIDGLTTLADWLALEYRGVRVGQFAVASAMRGLRAGQFDFRDPAIRAKVRPFLETSIRFTLAGIRVLDEIRPACVVVLDPGYTGQGELFDLAIQRGIDAVRWQGGHKSNILLFKRYHAGNVRDHHASLSKESWRQVCAIPWTPDYGRQVRDELLRCYEAQEWFSSVGTQFGKSVFSEEATREKLELAPGKKVAVIFPHIFWDGSFFSGEDLFEDYTEWFIETIRVAIANPRLEWVVKFHPAHVVKARREGEGGSREMEVIENTFGKLPDHVKIVYPETDVSTYSFFRIADYVVTVRGTVGIEAAVFGIPVVTGGTGRYDHHGFTLDSATREEYVEKLATLETRPRLTPAQIELAERFAYGALFCRPVPLSSVSIEYERDGVATQKITVHRRRRRDWITAPDMRELARWFGESRAEDTFAEPADGGHGSDASALAGQGGRRG